MRDKRPVDELSIEELEQILAIRKREARMEHLRRYQGSGRVVAPNTVPLPDTAPDTPIDDVVPKSSGKAQPAQNQKVDNEIEDEPPEVPIPKGLPKVYFEDEPTFEDELDQQTRQRFRNQRSKRSSANGKSGMTILWNRLLVVIEIAAVFGLIYLVAGLFQVFQAASQTTASIQAQYEATANARLIPPTSTPLINIRTVVLPVGHTINVNDQGIVSAAFNLDEVPAEYRDQYRTLLKQPVTPPTASADGPIRIQIPALKIDKPVVEGDSWDALQLGVGHFIGSANPGQRGNMVLSAHNDVYGEIFRDLDKLKAGDTITISTVARDYTYVVQGSQIVKPTDVWVLESRGDTKQTTLISCYPYRVDTKRIVVFATLQG